MEYDAAIRHYTAVCSPAAGGGEQLSTVQHMAVLSLAMLHLDRNAPDAVAMATETLKQHGLFTAMATGMPQQER